MGDLREMNRKGRFPDLAALASTSTLLESFSRHPAPMQDDMEYKWQDETVVPREEARNIILSDLIA
jgi:hypothetical protein